MVYYSVWVGGLKGVVQEKDLTSKFSQYGDILHVMLTRDPETKTSRYESSTYSFCPTTGGGVGAAIDIYRSSFSSSSLPVSTATLIYCCIDFWEWDEKLLY